jgi:hypothetical protein
MCNCGQIAGTAWAQGPGVALLARLRASRQLRRSVHATSDDLVAELADDARVTSTCPSIGSEAYPISRVRSDRNGVKRASSLLA